MDHLCYPLKTEVEHLYIPLLCDGEAEYDGGPFSTYPSRKGWSESTRSLQWLGCSDKEFATRVQLWLYFGLLSSFCGHPVLRTVLRHVDTSDGTIRVSTLYLPRLLDNRARNSRCSHLDDEKHLLEEALRLSDLVERQVTSSKPLLSSVSCSVRVLIQTLNSAQGLKIEKLSSFQRYQVGRRWPFKFSTSIVKGWKIPVAKAIKFRMAHLGWCPFQIEDLGTKYSCNMMYYLSGLRRRGEVSHVHCDDSRCLAYNIDESQYEPRHDINCCRINCAIIQVTPTAIASIIGDNNGIPLISCYQSTEEPMQMRIIRAKPGMRYIAVSHVWSGGLGNPAHNGLPECEVRQLTCRISRLRTAISSRYSINEFTNPGNPLLFWMDTFCIPVGQPFRLARKMAINAMAEIFSGADTVLVLDPELERLPHDTMTSEQSLGHVLCSSWMSRCWTLLEASLASSWYVQFKDGAVNITKIMQHSHMKHKREFLVGLGTLQVSMGQTLNDEISSFLSEMGEVRYHRRGRYDRSEIWNLKQLEAYQAYIFATTWNNFLGRTTSKLKDLHQIWAALEDMKVAEIRNFSVDDRMKAILKCHASLPIDLLFCNCDRICDEEGVNVWAPKSPEGQRLDESFGTMKVFSDCLYISKEEASEHLRLYLIPLKYFNECGFYVDIPNKGRFWIKVRSSELCLETVDSEYKLCLVFPIRNSQSEISVSSEIHGAKFLLRSDAEGDLRLRYYGSFCMYACDGRRGVACVMESCCPLIEPLTVTTRIFIECALESWPTAPLLYDTVEGPIWTKPAPHVIFATFTLVYLTWTLSFIVTMAIAEKVHMGRRQVIFCYMARLPFAFAEIIWYAAVFERIEREAWSLNASTNGADFSHYALINKYPSLFIGFKRGAIMLGTGIILLSLGTVHQNRKWALWLGILVSWEFSYRAILYIGWLILPRIHITRSWIERGREKLFPRFMSGVMRGREDLRVRHERVPFREEDVEPFESWSKVWGFYMSFFRNLI